MRICIFLLSLLAVSAVAGAARADDGEDGAAGVWVYEVRVVRVDPAVAETSETPSTLESATGTTVKMGWPEMLAALKQRGRTTVLLDQRITKLEGVKGYAMTERAVPIVSIASSDINNTQKRSATIKTGCKFEATTTTHLQYNLEAKWILDAPGGDFGPPQQVTGWNGTHPNLSGETLVLSYREQVDQGPGKAARAVEIYGLITGRFVK